MYDLARLAREGWQIVITYTDGFYVDISRWGVSYTGYSEKNISEAVRDLVEKMPDKSCGLTSRAPDAPKSAPVCTCSMDDGIHEWNCALEKARRLRKPLAADC